MALRAPELWQVVAKVREHTEQLTCRIVAESAAQHGIEPAMPPRRIAAFFLASFAGLADRRQAEFAAGIAEPESDGPLEMLVACLLGLCLGTVPTHR